MGMGIWDVFWTVIWGFFFFAYLFVLILIVIDLFRDHTLAGGWKALWVVFLIFVPLLTSLVYLVVRGVGMSERMQARMARPAEVDDYRPAPSSSPATDIARAKELLDSGAITQGEFDALKSKALGAQYFGTY
jgi:hypothetical protein